MNQRLIETFDNNNNDDIEKIQKKARDDWKRLADNEKEYYKTKKKKMIHGLKKPKN